MTTRGRVEALHLAMHDACFGAGDSAAHDLDGLVARSGVHADDVAALREGPRRYPLYRKLVRGTLAGVSESILARARAHVEAAAPGTWDATLDDYLAGRGPRTPHLRDVPRELCDVLLPRLMQDARVPAYVAELCRFELAEFALGAHPDVLDPAGDQIGEVDAGLPLALREPYARLHVTHAVHELSVDVPDHVPAKDTRLFLYRNDAHDVVTVVLTPFADELLARILGGGALGDAIGGAAAELGVPLSEGLLTEVARWLADFGARGIVLGSRRVSE